MTPPVIGFVGYPAIQSCYPPLSIMAPVPVSAKVWLLGNTDPYGTLIWKDVTGPPPSTFHPTSTRVLYSGTRCHSLLVPLSVLHPLLESTNNPLVLSPLYSGGLLCSRTHWNVFLQPGEPGESFFFMLLPTLTIALVFPFW